MDLEERFKHIVLFQLGWLGDSVMTVPAMALLRKQFKGSKITRVVNEVMEVFFRDCPYVDEVIPFRREPDKFREGLKLLKRIRRMKPDAFLNLHTPDFDRPFIHYFRDNLFACLTGAPVTAAYARSIDSLFLSHPTAHGEFGEMRMDGEMLRVVLPIATFRGFDTGSFWLTQGEREKARALLYDRQGGGEPVFEGDYFCVSPFGKRSNKEWDFEKMGALCNEVAKKTGMAPVILGSPGDVDKASLFVSTLKSPFINLVGKTSIKVVGAVIEGAKVMVSIDSGLMHLAGLIGKPVVALFGPGNPQRWGPLKRGPAVIFSGNADCAPCFIDECSDKTCFDEINLEEVINEVLRLSE